MGIQGLLPWLDPVLEDVRMKNYSGKKIAVDGRAWLYRGAFGCAFDLCMNLDTNRYITYFIQMVQSLLLYKVIPIIVFEGQTLPLKSESKIQQSLLKEKYLHEGYYHAENGSTREAKKAFQKSFHITEEMIHAVIKALDEINVEHVVAPYDVGPQLAYMEKHHQVEAIVTEDSEVLAFGCDTIIYQLDRHGNGKRIQYSDIIHSDVLNISQFTRDMFRYMCITTGCSFLPSISVAGINRARELVKRNPTMDKLFKAFRARFSTAITEPYQKGFQQADAAFQYQFVFDIDSKCYDRLNPIPRNLKVSDFYLLGQDPQNRFLTILRTNNAARLPRFNSSCEARMKDNALEPEENLDALEFETMNEIDSVKENVKPVPASSVQAMKAQPSRPIVMPKSLRRGTTPLSDNHFRRVAPSSSSNNNNNTRAVSTPPPNKHTNRNDKPVRRSASVPNNPFESKEYLAAMKAKATLVPFTGNKRHETTITNTTTHALKENKQRAPKRKLLTLEDALPARKVTRLDDEDPFGLGLDPPV